MVKTARVVVNIAEWWLGLTTSDQCGQNPDIIFQMDWKRYVIVLTKYLKSSLRPEVYQEISGYTVTMVPSYCLLQLSVVYLSGGL